MDWPAPMHGACGGQLWSGYPLLSRGARYLMMNVCHRHVPHVSRILLPGLPRRPVHLPVLPGPPHQVQLQHRRHLGAIPHLWGDTRRNHYKHRYCHRRAMWGTCRTAVIPALAQSAQTGGETQVCLGAFNPHPFNSSLTWTNCIVNVVFLDNSNKVGRDGCLGIKQNIFNIWDTERSKQRSPLIHVTDLRRDQGSKRNTISRGAGGSCPKRVLDACVHACPSFSRCLLFFWQNYE